MSVDRHEPIDSREREMALREQNRKLSAVLDAMQDAAALIDRDLRILYLNRVAAEELSAVTGVPRESMLGKTARELGLPLPIVEQFERTVPTVLAGAETSIEYLLPTRAGLRWREDRAGPIRGPDGTVEAFATVSRDVDDAKRAAETLARTLAFRDQIIAILGHDLRNPLAAVRSLADLSLRVEDVPERVRAHLTQIDLAARRMSEMIATLIDFARCRFGGSLPISPAEADLRQLCGRAIDELAVAYPACRIELESTGDVTGQWDAARLLQAVSNLVGNAVVHGAHDAPVHVAVRGDDGETVLRVANRGPPIPPDVLPVLFEPFRRDRDEASPNGLGLGLYIVRQIALAHRGTIAVESGAVEGTVFTLRLPRRRA